MHECQLCVFHFGKAPVPARPRPAVLDARRGFALLALIHG
jgi:hypothetical protein